MGYTLVIAGSRTLAGEWLFDLFDQVVQDLGEGPEKVISGGAGGVDTWARYWGRDRGYVFMEIPAEWDRYGRSAGYRRNEVMVGMADYVVAVWDGQSPGTKHTIDISRAQGRYRGHFPPTPITVFTITKETS